MTRRNRIIVQILITILIILLAATALGNIGCAHVPGFISFGFGSRYAFDIHAVIDYNIYHTRYEECDAYNEWWTKQYGCLQRHNQYFGIYRGEYFYALFDHHYRRLPRPIILHLYRSIYDNPWRYR